MAAAGQFVVTGEEDAPQQSETSSSDGFTVTGEEDAPPELRPEVNKAIQAVPRPKSITPTETPLYDESPLDILTPDTAKDLPLTPKPQAQFTPADKAHQQKMAEDSAKEAAFLEEIAAHPYETAGDIALPGAGTAGRGAKELAVGPNRVQGATRLASGLGEVAAPFLGPAALESPVSTAIGLGTGAIGSEAGGQVSKAFHAKPETEDLVRTLSFWAPTIAGMLFGSTGSRVAVGSTPEAFGAGVRFGKGGDFHGIKIPRGPQPVDGGPAGIEPPTIEGELVNRQPPAPPDAVSDPIGHAAAAMGESGRSAVQAEMAAKGIPPPPPPPSGPPVPPEVAHGEVSQETVEAIGKALASLPPEIRSQAILEAHGTLSAALEKQGKVIGPTGEIHIIDSPKAASKLAADVINDEVQRHDEEAAKVKDKGAKISAANVQESPILKARASAKQNGGFQITKIEDAPQFQVVKEEDAPVESGNAETAAPALDAGVSETAKVAPSEPTKTAVNGKGAQATATETGLPAEPAKIAFAKGDQVVLKDGTKATVVYATPSSNGGFNIVRVKTANGKRLSVGARQVQPVASVADVAPVANATNATNAKPETKYKFGSTQANIPAESEAHAAIKTAQARISKQDLVPEAGGVETEPHVTVRYGIKGEDHEGIKKYLSTVAPFEATMGKTAKFPPSEYSDGAAIIHAPMEAPELHQINAELEKHGEFTEPSFKEFRPHATVAYVKNDKADRYVGMTATEGKKFKVNSIAITDKQGGQHEVKLGGKPKSEEANVEAKPQEPAGVKPVPEAKTGTGETTPIQGKIVETPAQRAQKIKAALDELDPSGKNKPRELNRVVRGGNVYEYEGGHFLKNGEIQEDGAGIAEVVSELDPKLIEGQIAPPKLEAAPPEKATPALIEGDRKAIAASELQDLRRQSTELSEQINKQGWISHTPVSMAKANNLRQKIREREDEIARLNGEPTHDEKRDIRQKAVEKTFGDRPAMAMTYGQPEQSQHWQVLEPDYIEKRFGQRAQSYEKAIPEKRAEVEKLKPGTAKHASEKASLHFWEQQLARFKERDPRLAQSFKTEYNDLVKKAVSQGRPVPTEVIQQKPEFILAKGARERYEKGRHTSFANRSAAIDDTMQKDEGFKVKRQDGKPIPEEQAKEISDGVNDVVEVLGPALRDMMRGTDLTIAHTNGKHPFLSDAGGEYHPVDRSISAGVKDFLGQPIQALAHELGHWLDFEAGRALNVKAYINSKSAITRGKETKYVSEADDRTGLAAFYSRARTSMTDTREVAKMLKMTKTSDLPDAERAEVERVKVELGHYWRDPRELWARMFEQYIAEKLGRKSMATEPIERYYKAPAWWSKEAWDKLKPDFEKELAKRMDALRERYAPTEAPAEVAAPAPELAEKPKYPEPTPGPKLTPAEMSLEEFEKEHSPYQITQQQWVDMQRRYRKSLGQSEESGTKYAPFGDFEEYHKTSVQEALKNGLKVPAYVIRDYPDLMPKAEVAKASEPKAEPIAAATQPATPAKASDWKVGETVTFSKIPPGSYLTPDVPFNVESVNKRDIQFRNPKTGGATSEHRSMLALSEYSKTAPEPPAKKQTYAEWVAGGRKGMGPMAPKVKVVKAEPEPTAAEKTFIGDVKKRTAVLREKIVELEKETSAPAAYYQDSAKNASARRERNEKINQLHEYKSELADIEQEHKYELAKRVEPKVAVPEEGKNFEGRYLKAALEPSRDFWQNLMNPEMYAKAAKGKLKAHLTPPKGEEKLLVKVPDDGTFLIPNTPVAIEHAIKAADKFTPEKPDILKPYKEPANRGPKEFDTEKYITGLEKEVANLQDEIGKANTLQKPYLEEQLKAANENLAEAKKSTPGILSHLVHDETGSFEPGKLGEVTQSLFQQDVHPALEAARIGLRDSVGLFIRAFYPRIEESNPVGRITGTAAPSDAVDALMRLKGDRAHAVAEFDGVLSGIEKMFDRLPDDQRVDFIDRMQNGKPQKTKEFEQIASVFRKIQAEQRGQEQAAANLGRKGQPIQLSKKENYFPNSWEKRPGGQAEEDDDQRVSKLFTPRRPLEGTKGYNKQQHYTLRSGIEAGGKPVTTNPVRIMRRRIEDGMKFVTARRAWDELNNLDLRTFVPQGGRRPPGFDPINDRIARVYFPAELASGRTAFTEGGQWYVEANTARLLNNMLSTDKIRGSAAGRTLMWLKNASTGLELGLSPFHAVFETIEAASSQFSLGMNRAVNLGIRGADPEAFAKGIVEAITSPVAPITMAREGGALPAYIEARSRLKAIGATEFGRPQIEGKQPHGVNEAIAHFGKVRNVPGIKRLLKRYPNLDQLVDDMFDGGMFVGQHRDYQTRAFGKTASEAWTAGNPLGAILRAGLGLPQTVMKPLFEIYIPNLKASMFLKQMSEQVLEHSEELEAGTLTRETLARQVADTVSDRFGEMGFDTLFLNNTVKSSLQIAFRSVTYRMGTGRQFAGALGGQTRDLANWARQAYDSEYRKAPGAPGALPHLDPRASWIFSLLFYSVAMGTIASKALSGKYPWEYLEDDKNQEGGDLRHIFLETVHPRTGETDTHSKPVRISLPTYLKDILHASSNPKQYAMSSLSSILSKGMDLAENRDYFNNYVYSPTAGLGTQLKQAVTYAFPTPFSISNYQRGQQQGTGKTAWLSAFGFPKAPSDLDFSPAEKMARELLKSREAPHTPEEMEQWREKREAFKAGTLPRAEAKRYLKQQRESFMEREFKSLSYAEARQVYDVATPEEKQQLTRLLRQKRQHLLQRHEGEKVREAEAQ